MSPQQLRNARHAIHEASEHLVEALEWIGTPDIANESIREATREIQAAAEHLGLTVQKEEGAQ